MNTVRKEQQHNPIDRQRKRFGELPARHQFNELKQSLVHSTEEPMLSSIHRMLRRCLKVDPFHLTTVLAEVTEALCLRSLQESRIDHWHRIEMLLGYPGAKFAHTQFQANTTPVLIGISNALAHESINFTHYGAVEEEVVSFLIRNTHAAFVKADAARRHGRDRDTLAENQLSAGLHGLELIQQKLKPLENPSIVERVASCLRRAKITECTNSSLS